MPAPPSKPRELFSKTLQNQMANDAQSADKNAVERAKHRKNYVQSQAGASQPGGGLAARLGSARQNYGRGPGAAKAASKANGAGEATAAQAPSQPVKPTPMREGKPTKATPAAKPTPKRVSPPKKAPLELPAAQLQAEARARRGETAPKVAVKKAPTHEHYKGRGYTPHKPRETIRRQRDRRN